MAPKKIAFYGNFGSGNLGNECTLQVVLEHVRRCWPDTRLLCICTVPQDARVRHNICATHATVIHSGWTPAHLDTADPAPPCPPSPARGARRIVRGALRLAFWRLPRELAQWGRACAILLRTDMLVVPGTQIASDYLCGPMGWPYDIFRWSMLARLCRVELVFLSIGVGPLRHPLSRWLIRTSLGSARYRSYRDEHSRRYAESIGIPADRDAVYPDLAFSLARSHLPEPARRAGAWRIVGLGLKNYSGDATEATVRAYEEYLHNMAEFVSWLQRRGYEVRLLIGDLQYDLRPRRDLLELLARRQIAAQPPLLLVDDPHTVEELLAQLHATDVVISPRLHNLICAALLEKPVIALTDHEKLDSLLTALDLSDYRVALDGLRADALIERFADLEHDAERVTASLKKQVERCRSALEEQYERVFHTAQESA